MPSLPKGVSQIPTMSKEQLKLLLSMLQPMKGKEFDITRSPQYQQALQQMQGLTGYYQDLMSPTSQAYERFEAPMMQQFQQEIVPGIAERFSGLGAQSSSAFNQTMGQAGGDLATRLGALRSELQMRGAEGMQGLSKSQFDMGMMPYDVKLKLAALNQQRQLGALGISPFAYYQRPQKQPGGLSSFFGGMSGGMGSGIGQGIGTGLGSLIGGFFGGPPGAMAGGTIGGGIGGMFGKQNNL